MAQRRRQQYQPQEPDDFEPWQPEAAPVDDFEPWQPEPAPQIQAQPPEPAPSAQAQPDDFVPWQPEPQAPPEPEAEGTISTALRSAAHTVLPSAAGLAAIPLGIAGGAAAFGLPTAGIGAIPGAVIGGIGAYMGASKAQEAALKAMGFDDSQQMAVNTKTNPKSALVGEIAGALPTVGVGAGINAVVRAGGAIGGGLLETGSQALGSEPWDPTRIAGATVAGGLLTKPTRLGEAIGGGAARAIGRPELWHGSGGPDAAAGTSKEQPPPRPTPDAQAQVPTDYYAKPPRVTEGEAPPAVAAERPPQVFEGEAPPVAAQAPAPQMTPVDPAIDAAVNKRPIGPQVTPVEEPPTRYGPALDREFPRVTEMPEMTPPAAARGPQVFEGEAPPAAARGSEPRVLEGEAPPVVPVQPATPREAMAQRAPEETYGQVLRRLAADERGGGRLPPRKPPTEEPGAGPVAETLPKELAGAKPRYAYGSKQFQPEFASDIDKALFITAQTKKSTSDAKYRDWLTKQGFSDEDIGRLGQQVRNEIKVQAAGAPEGGRLVIDPIARRPAAAAEAMPTPGVFAGDVIPDAAAKADAALIARGFTPEEIAKMKPKAKEAILQKREGEIGSGPKGDAMLRREAEVRAGPAAETLDRKLASRLVNQPAVLRSEAAKRGVTPEALKAQATEVLKTPALPGRPAEMSPVGGTPVASPAPAPTPAVAPPGKPPAPPAALPPAAGPPPTPPRVPKERLVEEGKIGDTKALEAAKKADDEIHKLTTVPAGEQYNYKKLATEAASMHPEIKTTGGQRIFEAIERGTYDQLPAKLRAGYEHATSDLLAEARAIREDLIKRKKIDPEPDDPNYVHRIVKSVPTKIVDPISEGRLPGMRDPSSTKGLAFKGAEDADGNRIVISGDAAVTKNRKFEGWIDNPNADEPLKTGDKITYNGKEYTVDRGQTREIERHAVHEDGTPVEYHKNAFQSAFAQHREMKMMKDYHDWLDNFKSDASPFKEYMTRNAETAAKRGWKQSEVPDLRGLFMHPNLEQAIHNNYNPGMGGPPLSVFRAINQFAVRSIFWNPVPHSMNAFMHYLVGRGWDLVPYTPAKIKNFVQATMEGFKSAYTQDALLQDLNKSGASLVMSKIDSQDLSRGIGKILEVDLKNNPAKWEQYAQKFGLGKGTDAVKAWYDASSRALWTFSDALMASRIRELELGGMPRPEAIEHARVHMPDYRLPIKFLGSTSLVRAMSDARFSMFGRYHMGMLNSLSTMMMNSLGPKASMAERKEALGNVFALTVLAFAAKPALDKLAQYVTGNEEAEFAARGPLGPLTSISDALQGKKDVGMTLSNIFTFSPAVKQITQTLANRDFAGRAIIERGSPWYKKAGQYAEYTAGNVLSPYGTFGPSIQPGTSRGDMLHEFISQATDIKSPTPLQIQGKQYGQLVAEREAKTRARKPRGLIEYGIEQVKPHESP